MIHPMDEFRIMEQLQGSHLLDIMIPRTYNAGVYTQAKFFLIEKGNQVHSFRLRLATDLLEVEAIIF
jgi:hypothetical protein